jgi:hypothetical protein
MSGAVATLDQCAAAAERFLSAAPRRRRDDVTIYLAHVEGSLSLRAVSHASGRALTSVHRAVRRIESLRDDPLLDRTLDTIGRWTRETISTQPTFDTDISGEAIVFEHSRVTRPDRRRRDGQHTAPSAEDMQARACLGSLDTEGSFLLVADGAGRAGVFCRSNGFRRPVHVIDVDLAADLAARDWIRCVSRTAASAKYVSTPAAKRWLGQATQTAGAARSRDATGAATRAPLAWLERRHGRGAQPLLSRAAIAAAAQMRDDFEIAQAGLDHTPDWQRFLAAMPPQGPELGDEPAAARRRLARALSELGTGLAEVTLAVCCFDEGLEAVERRMGWAARSAKVVLSIALSRLAAYYGIAEA